MAEVTTTKGAKVAVPGSGMMRLGTSLPGDWVLDRPVTTILGADGVITPHLGTPWLADHLRRAYQIDTVEDQDWSYGTVSADAAELATHCLIVGRTSSGKSRYALHLLFEQIFCGCSAIVMDEKEDTVLAAAEMALAAGVEPEDVTLLMPRNQSMKVPRWNPLLGDRPNERAAEFAGALERLYGASWVRISDLLMSACTVAGAQGLSLLEAMAILNNPHYQRTALARARETGAYERYGTRHEALENVFGRLSPGQRAERAEDVANKVRDILDNEFLSAMFLSDGDDLDLAGLWKKRRFIGIHLDPRTLGGAGGVAMLAAMVTNALVLESMAEPGPIPVVTFLDELSVYEKYIGGILEDILTRGRSRLMRFICATQTLSRVSSNVSDLLLSQSWLGAFFTLSDEDAKMVAATLPGGRARTVSCYLEADYARGGMLEMAGGTYPVTLPDGRQARLPQEAWTATFSMRDHASAVMAALRACGMGDAAVCGIRLDQCLPKLHGTAVFTGPQLALTAGFPRPVAKNELKVSATEAREDMARQLTQMEPRKCLLRCRATEISPTARTFYVYTHRTETKGIPPDTMRRMTPKGRTREEARRDRAARLAEISRLSSAPASAPPKQQPARPPFDPSKVPSTFDRKKDDGAL